MATEISDTIHEGQEFLSMFYTGINIENILYGVELFLYFKTMGVLLRNRRAGKRATLFYMFFSSMMLLMVTVWIATQAAFGQKMWLIDSDFPGGPSAYWRKYIAIWYIDWGTTAIVILQLMTDALMIYRCRIIWDSYRIIVVPIILWVASFILGVAVDWTTSSPGGDYFTGVSTPLSIAYWSVSVFLCIVLTCLICYRVSRHGKMIQERLGREYASLYFSLVTIIVEAVLPYTFSGIAALVSLGAESTTSVVFVAVYFMMMCISPQMLLLRVASGKAWNHDTLSDSTIQFNPGTVRMSEAPWLDGGATRADIETLSNTYRSGGHDKERLKTQEV